MDSRLLWYAVVFCVSVTTAAAQKHSHLPQDTLARVGSAVITTRDLLHRIESVPFAGAEKTSNPKVIKERALHAMIAERLLGQEGKRLGLPGDKKSKRLIHELENIFVRDELYKRKIASKAKVSEEKIISGLKRLPYEVRVLSFLVRSQHDGEALSARLRSTKSQSDLNILPGSLTKQMDTITVRFGAPDTAYERAAYAIGKSRVSKSFYSSNFGWVVLYLLDKHAIPEIGKLNLAERRHRVEKLLRERLEGKLVNEYYFRLLQSKHGKADERLFNVLADSLLQLVNADEARRQEGGAFVFSSGLVDEMIDHLLPLLDSTLVKVEGNDLSLGEVLEMFRYEDYRFRSLEVDSFRIDLNEGIKILVGRALLAEEGRREGLLSSEAVQRDMQLWTDYLAAAELYNRLRDSVVVSDEDISGHLIKNKAVFGSQYEVNVCEVLRNNSQDMKIVLDELANGRTVTELAAQYSTRTEWLKSSGVSGFFKVHEHPEIGFRALNADTGTLVGPVQLPEGYSIFKVLGKRSTQSALTSFDTLKHNVRARVLAEKRKNTLHTFIVNLARYQNVNVNYERLKSVKVSLIPTFSRRFIGFGGRMTAAPLLMHQWDWAKEYLPTETLP